ncbi:methyl-accepting chemotaxis protein [Geminocystis sp. NIES-3709]|uniref:methyl-accepting chemotaxis protein n=1 Tax=Geminocystis sp. NIES-3709 TaxID=1617448 RepID=UPI0005FCC559|nr:methyl-accepting chemotaxis protein [Geminocystis sp. NIES-3709]BAQ65299.1 methyl-accepting chemotaxis protein [Geminocystis sp. NIES-3709]
MTQTSPQPNQINKDTQSNTLENNLSDSSKSENINVNGVNSSSKNSPHSPQDNSQKQGIFSWFESQNLRFKFRTLAIALGVTPLLLVGTAIGVIVNSSFQTQIENSEKKDAEFIETKLDLKINENYLDVQTMASLFGGSPDFANRNTAKLNKELNNIKEKYNYYDSIALFDTKGNVIAQTTGKPLGNHLNRTYIQEAKAKNGATVSNPLISATEGIFSIYTASVIKNPTTGQNIGFIRMRVPVSKLGEILLSSSIDDGKSIYLTDDQNQLFYSSKGESLTSMQSDGKQLQPKEGTNQGVKIDQIFPKLKWEETEDKEAQSVIADNVLEKRKQLIAYKPIDLKIDNVDLNWNVIVADNVDSALAPAKNVSWYVFWGILISAGIVGWVADILAGKFITPIEKTSKAIKEISRGDLDVEIEVYGKDEIADLGNSINEMTFQLKTLLLEQQMFATQSSLLKNMTLEMTKAFDINEVFEIAVREIRQALQSDRVIVYSFDDTWKGTVIAESVGKNYPKALGAQILDPCFADKYVDKYIQGRIQSTPDIYKAGLTECHLNQLEPFAVKANLVAPIVANGSLLGLLIAHQCSSPRNWQTNEIEFFAQTATQMGPALERVMLFQSQQLDSFLSVKLKDISFKIAESLNKDKVFEVATNLGREALGADRVIIYTFDEDWKGTVIVESVDPKYPRALGAAIKDPCFADKYVEKYKEGRVQATNNIYTAGLTSCHIQQLEPFEIKANLVTPIIIDGSLLGLLIAHQCNAPRQWTESECIFLSQLATQIGPALERIQLLAKQQASELEQRKAREIIQQRALELLMQVDPVSQGDLTIRATVTEDEIGTIADSYNATIESLRKIVTQVQGGTRAVSDVVREQERFVEKLATEIIRQADDINIALEKVQVLAFSARMVLDNAEQAEEAVKQANRSVEEGEVAMNRTVDGILAIRETVAETAKKVKRLGESTQKISKVVNLIGSFADQTNLLALNASIEAAHAGEEGRGFAVVAEEVRSLARQSAQATAEIEKVVAEIQEETNDVVKAMEFGTEQVVEGTKLVEETRASLTQITAASAQINQLVTAIAAAAAEQSQTSEDITETMAEVAGISNDTSTAVTQVSRTFKKLLKVSENLQQSVSKFKVS